MSALMVGLGEWATAGGSEVYWSEGEKEWESEQAVQSWTWAQCRGGGKCQQRTPPTLSTLRACGVSLVDVVSVGVGEREPVIRMDGEREWESLVTTCNIQRRGKGWEFRVDKRPRNCEKLSKWNQQRACGSVCVRLWTYVILCVCDCASVWWSSCSSWQPVFAEWLRGQPLSHYWSDDGVKGILGILCMSTMQIKLAWGGQLKNPCHFTQLFIQYRSRHDMDKRF